MSKDVVNLITSFAAGVNPSNVFFRDFRKVSGKSNKVFTLDEA